MAGEVSSGALRATRKWAAPAVVAGFLTTLYSASAAETISALGVPWKIGAPIVTYWCGPALTDAVAKQMAEGGWNLVWCNEPSLDIAQRHGLGGQVENGLLTATTLEDPKRRAELDAFIARVSKHPALYAYHLTDEPSAGQFPALGKLVAYLRERDPAHLAYINHEFITIATELKALRSLGVYHAGMMPPGADALPKDAVLTLDPPLAAMNYNLSERVKGARLGVFGSASQTTAAATHAIVVNLDYKSEMILGLRAASRLEIFDATTGRWSAGDGSKMELKLAGGSGKLVRVK